MYVKVLNKMQLRYVVIDTCSLSQIVLYNRGIWADQHNVRASTGTGHASCQARYTH